MHDDYKEKTKEELLKKISELLCQQKEINASFMHSPIGIYIIQNKKFVFSNIKFQKIFGFTGQELNEKESLDLVFSEDVDLVRENAVKMLKGENKEPYKFRVQDKQGDILWIVETVAPIHYMGKQAVIGHFMDITESEGLRISFMNSPIGIYIIQDGKFIYSNEKFQKITGFTAKELLNKTPESLICLEDRQKVRVNAIKMLKGLCREAYQFRILNKKNKFRWIIESVSSIHYMGRRAVLGNFMNITRFKRIEEALLESERKYHSLFELAREGIVLIDYKDGSILDSNKEFLNQTGYDPNYLNGKKIWDIQPIEFKQEAKESFFRFRETCGGIVSWRLCQRKGDKVLPVEIVAQRMKMDEKEVILCMVRDISEREAMMRALTLASEEWRRSFDALDDAILIINPDFEIHRANLAAARLLDMDVRDLINKKCYNLVHGTDSPPEYCPKLTSHTKGIYCEVERKEEHLDRVLHFSSSPIKDELGDAQLSVEIISDVTSHRKYEQESIRLSKALVNSFQGITESLSDLAESRDPYTAGHSRHVSKLAVLTGKEMGLEEEDLQGLRTCAILHDIGKSIIPAAILNKPGKLSEHEWGLIQAHPKTAYEALHHIPFPWPVADVVYQHHERMNGSGYPRGLQGNEIHLWARIIAVADLVDAMTSHRPYRPGLPRKNAMEELKRGYGILYDEKVCDALMRAMRLEDKRILVVDNDSYILNGIVEELKLDGLEPIGLNDPNTALQLFEKKPFPLVITELNLPGMDGARLTKKLKKINSDTEIIIIASLAGKEEALRVLRSGASDFLEKPIDSTIFRKSINRALQRFAGKIS
ncbi:PAS domain S-box protein [Candidatus Magnetomoraceae bacterium gMMP-15]